ncbi:baculoviral IAP repeat-containing protein 1-like [Mustelus asterias]
MSALVPTPGPEAEEEQGAGTGIHHRQLDVPLLQAVMSSINLDIGKFVAEMDREDEALCRERKRGFEHRMRSELNRLKTFESFGPFASWSPEEMAEAGFYFIGVKMSVQCFCCGGIFCNASITKTPRSEHQRFEPDCGFVKGLDVGNIPKYAVRVQPPEDLPPGRREQLGETASRLETFTNWPFYAKMEPGLLAEAGFFHTGLRDKVQCFSCDGSLADWQEGDDPWMEHSKWFPECAYVRSAKSASEIDRYTGSYIGFPGVTGVHFLTSSDGDVCTEGSDSWSERQGNVNVFAEERSRLESFHTWPPDVNASPAELAKAGFFYRGFGDQIQCFCCGVQLCRWQEGDEAWMEHERHSPECPHLLRRPRASGGDVDQERLKELSVKTPPGEPRQNEDSGHGGMLSGGRPWAGAVAAMRRRLRKLYTSSAFAVTSFNDCVTLDLRQTFTEPQLHLKSIADRALRRVTLPELARDLERVTLLGGEVGSGKSALLRRLAILWAGGGCPLLSRFDLVLYLSQRPAGSGRGADSAGKAQLPGSDFPLSEGALGEVAGGLRNRLLVLLDDYGETEPGMMAEQLIRRNHLTHTAVLVGLRTNRIAGVRQFANTVISLADFPLYSSIWILKTLFSHDVPRLRKLIYRLGWCQTLRGIFKSPLFALSVCQLWVRRPLEDAVDGLLVFRAYLSYSTRETGPVGEAAITACGQLALSGIFASRFEFAEEDLQLAGVCPEEALGLGLLSKFTAQRLRPVYRFPHVPFQEFMAGMRLGGLLGSEVTREEGLAYLRQVDTFLEAFIRFHYLLAYTVGDSAQGASQVVRHLLDMTGKPSAFESQADPTPYLRQHPDLEISRDFFVQFAQVLEPEGLLALATNQVLEFALRSTACQEAQAAVANLILDFLAGKRLCFKTSSLSQGSTFQFLRLHPQTLPLLDQLEISVSGRKAVVGITSYSKMAECMGHFGAPQVEEDYVESFQSLKKQVDKTQAQEKDIASFFSMVHHSIPESFMAPFRSLPARYKAPKLKLDVCNIDVLQEGEAENLLTFCSLSDHIELSLRDARGVLGKMEPAIELYRDRFKALTLHAMELSPEEEDLVISLRALESLELNINKDQFPENLLSRMDQLEHLKGLTIDMGPNSSQRIIDQIPEGIAKPHNLEKLILSGISLAQDSSKLANILRNAPELRVFRLKCDRVPEFEELIDALSTCSRLEELTLTDVHLSSRETSAFVASLGQFQNIKILGIPRHDFSQPEESEIFARALGSLGTLEELRLCRSDGNITAAIPLAQEMQNLRQLRVLSITNGLDDRSLVRLAEVAKSGHLSKLQTLDLSMNEGPSDLGWRDFFLTLDNMNELRELNISRMYTNQLKPQPDTCKALVQCVSRLPSLVNILMLSWMLDAMDFNMFNAMKENHPQSRRLRLLQQWTLPFTPIVLTEE